MLFAAASPLGVAELARLLAVTEDRLRQAVEYLAEHPPLGLSLQCSENQLQLVSAPSCAAAVERYFGAPPPVRLSRAALEALAVIAYRQPTTRAEIDAVRGVNSDSAVATLLARGLVHEVGRREAVGRPALLATTPDFLQYLGLPSLLALPPLPSGAMGAEPADARAGAE